MTFIDLCRLEEHIVSFYKNLFTSKHVNVNYDAMFDDISIPLLDSSNKDLLAREFTREEILNALKNMYPIKSPSPNGFHALFYQNIGI